MKVILTLNEKIVAQGFSKTLSEVEGSPAI